MSAAIAFTVIIPARRASTRLPDKPLADIGGKPMVVRVAERATASGAARVVVATDDDAIARAVRGHGFEAIATRADHASGTDRIAEVAATLALADDAIVVNVQGDEPLIDPALVAAAARALADAPDCAMATACHPLASRAAAFDPNVVKVVRDRAGRALYFSRAPIAWARGDFDRDDGTDRLRDGIEVFRHVGLYAYRTSFLKAFASLEPAPLEMLEQLRALWHGHRIAVFVADREPAAGVDTPADLERVRALVAAGRHG